jgi:VWFA-related protein
VRRATDVSGRIFIFFIDDLHLQFQNTPRVRALLKTMGSTLLHEGDLFGVVSTGTSSISIQPTYDRKRFDAIIDKITGDELKPSEIINGPGGTFGPSEVQHRARVAMDTVNELLENLEKLHDRRKAILYVSDGYDFVPFQNARLGLKMDANSPYLLNQRYRDLQNELQSGGQDPNQGVSTTDPNPTGSQQAQKEEFGDADLALALARLTRAANRANATIYTVDPRGLVGTPDIDEPVEPRQWSAYILKSQDTLRELADETGGIAVVNSNDFDKALKRIDAEASDYYVLGYYSANPDPTRRLRRIEVRVNRPNIDVVSRKEYIVKSPPRSPSKR